MIYPIEMKNAEDALRVSNEASRAGLDLTVSAGTIILDPRSLLALFTLIGMKAVLVAPDNTDPEVFMRLIKRMGVAA
jgi:hypothetical protein